MTPEEEFKLFLDLRDSMNNVAHALKAIEKQLDTLLKRAEAIEDTQKNPKTNMSKTLTDIIKMLILIVAALVGAKITGVI